MSKNSCSFRGRLTRDPEMKRLSSGDPVTNFSLAVNKTWKGKDGDRREQTTYVDFEAWNATAEFISQYCKKGDLVSVDDSEYCQNSKEVDGENKRYHRFKVKEFDKLTWDKIEKQEEGSVEHEKPKAVRTKKTKDVTPQEDEEDLPF